MVSSTQNRLGFLDSRRALRLIKPALQLRLPLYLLLVSVTFGALFAWHAYSAFSELYAMVVSVTPNTFDQELEDQAWNFAVLCGVLLVGYAIAGSLLCVSFTYKILGPMVPLRRQIQRLKDGSYDKHVKLRDGDHAFAELAQELNDLTDILARASRRKQG